MSDYGGAMMGAMMLSQQISTDRFLDDLRRDREVSDLARNDAAWQNAYNQLASSYNQLLADHNTLVNRFNQLLDTSRERGDLANRLEQRVGDLETDNDALRSERKYLQARYANDRLDWLLESGDLVEARAEIKVLRQRLTDAGLSTGADSPT